MRALTFLYTLLVPTLVLAASEGGHGDHGGGHGGGHGEHGHGPMTLDSLLHGDSLVELIVAAINFVLLIFLLRKMLGGSISSHIQDRRAEVEVGMKEAAEMKAKAEEAYRMYTERLETLDAEMAKLRKDIEAAADAEKNRIMDEAKAETQRVTQEAERAVERHAAALQESIKTDVVQAAVEAAELTLREAMKPEDQKRLAEQYLAELPRSTGGAA